MISNNEGDDDEREKKAIPFEMIGPIAAGACKLYSPRPIKRTGLEWVGREKRTFSILTPLFRGPDVHYEGQGARGKNKMGFRGEKTEAARGEALAGERRVQ